MQRRHLWRAMMTQRVVARHCVGYQATKYGLPRWCSWTKRPIGDIDSSEAATKKIVSLFCARARASRDKDRDWDQRQSRISNVRVSCFFSPSFPVSSRAVLSWSNEHVSDCSIKRSRKCKAGLIRNKRYRLRHILLRNGFNYSNIWQDVNVRVSFFISWKLFYKINQLIKSTESESSLNILKRCLESFFHLYLMYRNITNSSSDIWAFTFIFYVKIL